MNNLTHYSRDEIDLFGGQRVLSGIRNVVQIKTIVENYSCDLSIEAFYMLYRPV
jgi:hypothetical protein